MIPGKTGIGTSSLTVDDSKKSTTFTQACSIIAIGSVSIIKNVLKIINETAIGQTSIIKTIGKIINESAIGQATIIKNIGKQISDSGIGSTSNLFLPQCSF